MKYRVSALLLALAAPAAAEVKSAAAGAMRMGGDKLAAPVDMVLAQQLEGLQRRLSKAR